MKGREGKGREEGGREKKRQRLPDVKLPCASH